MKQGDRVSVMMVTGKVSDMTFCGDIPSHRGQRAIVLTNGVGCFAARQTPQGWAIIPEPVALFPILHKAARTQSDLHNELAGTIVASIVKPPLEAGGGVTDVLVLLESVILGVILAGVKLGGDEIVLDEVVTHVKERLAKHRLGSITPAGEA